MRHVLTGEFETTYIAAEREWSAGAAIALLPGHENSFILTWEKNATSHARFVFDVARRGLIGVRILLG